MPVSAPFDGFILHAAATTVPLLLEGWRVAFLLAGAASLAAGLTNVFFTDEPRDNGTVEQVDSVGFSNLRSLLGRIAGDVAEVLRVPTFVLIVIQGKTREVWDT